MEILVTGSTGFVGKKLISQLQRTKHSITALTRNPEKHNFPDNIKKIKGNLLDLSSIEDIFEKIDIAYYLVHSMKSGKGFAEKDKKAAKNFVRASSNSNLKRVVYLSGLGKDEENLSEHLRSRHQVEQILSEGDYKLTTFRAAIIIGKGSSSFKIIRQISDRLPVMVTPKWVRNECQPIAIDDVIKYLIKTLDVPETAGKTFEIGGPDVLTYQKMIKKTANYLGKNPIIIPFPFLSLRLSVYWIDLVTNVPKEIAHPLVYGLKNPVVVTDDSVKNFLSVDLISFDMAVKKALSDEH